MRSHGKEVRCAGRGCLGVLGECVPRTRGVGDVRVRALVKAGRTNEMGRIGVGGYPWVS